MTANKNAILFDLDGITIDTEPLYTRAEIRLFGEYGVKIPKKDLHLFRGCSENKFFDLSMKRYGITESRDIFINRGRQYVIDEFNKNIDFVPGFTHLHHIISKQYIIGLVTASPRSSLDWVIKKMNLNNYFKHIISGEETKKNKPFPEPYIAMMEKICVLPDNTIIIEDSLVGIHSALASGAHVIAKSGSVPRKELNIAHYVVDHLDKITIKLIKEILLEVI